MRAALQTLCDQFIQNRNTIKAAFKWSSSYMIPVCAHLFAAAGKTADADALLHCRDVVKHGTKWHSPFRGNVNLPLLCMLSMAQDPVATLRRIDETYRAFRTHFPASDHLALAAVLMSDEVDPLNLAARAKALWTRIRKEHPFLTGAEDTLFTLLLSRMDKTDDELLFDMEESYLLLKSRFGNVNWTQSVSHILALQSSTPQEKATRLFELYDAISLAGGKYGKAYELPALAAFASVEADPRAAAMDIMDVDLFLSEQAGYGFFGTGKQTRLMHAIMIVSGEYAHTAAMDSALLSSMLSLIITQQQAAT